MYIGQARVTVKEKDGSRVYKRDVNLGETRELILDEAKHTFSPFEIISLKVKWYFNSEVRKQLTAKFLTTPPEKSLALWIDTEKRCGA
ncbi:MAG: hypothetical protein J6Q61_01075 [Bacteroidales bacterium]|nr:hypothetical protein [Bacteroidales bacterium]